ncbi:tetrahydrofolate synthase [Flavobacterium magnum]|uniref:Dihydrofolate synthase/folylpolyglutamate synthase n=1 Tax=Flavobacterium magnum TaxID=2162713 RepID=A0A2S0RD64_9FLAO|nr:folylpolyglutamate synthase/dihydrofolate synthase family protein [Flavobacterium magnum]AWA29683.1 tetrahydrofolate synthase [Flavobacterium magnum]
MDYRQTVGWMFNQLPMYQHQGASAYKADLTNILLLSEHLGFPEKGLKCIHVAGTNGKGSTSHLLASVFQEAGYRTGLYTSPHLKDFRERIKVNGAEIPEAFVVKFISENKSFFESHALSFFEMTVGLALDYFRSEQTDVAIIEVGMGGRLDATNIITPLVSVITNIGLDHTQFLGDTIPEIASEKAGIIKEIIPVVIGEHTRESYPVFLDKAKEMRSDIYFAADLENEDYPSALIGDYQRHNKKTVLQALEVINSQGVFRISDQDIRKGFLNVVANTGLQGRWQQLGHRPLIIADTAHNPHGLEAVMPQIMKQQYQRLHIVMGVVNDKDLDAVLPLFPKKAIYYFAKPDIPRGLPAANLQAAAAQFGLTGNVYDSVQAAYGAARHSAAPEDFIYVGGSTFVVAEIL